MKTLSNYAIILKTGGIKHNENFFKQNEDFSSFDSAGITECRFKELCRSSDNKKLHHHTEFEIHIISNGFQVYKANQKEYRINAGELLLIPPKIKHQCVGSSDNILKYAITFKAETLDDISDCIITKAGNQIYDNIEYILKESRKKFFSHATLLKTAHLKQ